MTVLEVIQRGTDFLARKNVDCPRLQVELLLAHVLQLPRLKLYLSFERVLTEHELEVLRKMLKRRADREPLQHIVGSTCFCGLEMSVTREVLIPRPETELLAERAWELLHRLASEGQANPSVLDFGTGSGCLAVTLAVKCPQTSVSALDISEAALNVARHNAQRHHSSERIQFYLGQDFSVIPAEVRFDLLVSNPPYIPSPEIETLQPEVRDYEPRVALDGGKDGLTMFRFLATKAPAFIRPGGYALLELGDGQAESVREIFQQQGWIVERVQEDYSGRPRILIACRPK